MSHIDYEKLIDRAMHIIVKNSLETIKDNHIPGNHHFYISFLTNHPEVEISSTLRKKYPEEMTIVLQHQFEDLAVYTDRFTVTLRFNGKKEHLVIAFAAMTAFADPSVKFGLQFKHVNKNAKLDSEIEATSQDQIEIEKKQQDPEFNNVVAFDQIRKTKKG